MAKTHLSKVRTNVRGMDWTITGTLCNRMSNASDDLNVTEIEAEVTCKFCLNILTAERRGKAMARFEAA